MHTGLIRAACAAAVVLMAFSPAQERRTNVIIFVPDGLRSLDVTPESAPAMASLRARGVDFRNPHSMTPTVTMANASAMATGHYVGDTGVFSNAILSIAPNPSASGSITPFIEHDGVLRDLDSVFGGDFLGETTVLAAARAAGVHTAVIGKLGPAFLFDHLTPASGPSTIFVDDATGTTAGIPFSDVMREALTAAGLPTAAPSRGANGNTGNSTTPGTLVANVAQQNYFVDVATRVVLPMFKRQGGPFCLVFWSRDPDGSEHNQGDSLNALTPGVNGPTSRAAIANADSDLARIEAALAALGLTDTTDIIVAADHGFSTISKETKTSPAARASFAGVPAGYLPPGFLALDIGAALALPVFDPDNNNGRVTSQSPSKRGSGLIGQNPTDPQVIVAANGGTDLVYLPGGGRDLLDRIVAFLNTQDYTSALFVDEAITGNRPISGTLPLSAIGLDGSAKTPRPALLVGFRTFSTGCAQPELCGVEIADHTLQQGQGMHGSFSRADTMNFMAAAGPSFKQKFADDAPVSNADVGRTLAQLLGVEVSQRGSNVGRVMAEALRGGPPASSLMIYVSGKVSGFRPGDPGVVQTEVRAQQVGHVLYVDAAGTAGRTLGIR